jgi:hypothetical protein
MKELARIQFRGEAKDFIHEWNAHSTLKIEQRVIALYKDLPEYQRMHQMFLAFAQQHSVTWVEYVDVEYSDHELESFELLTLHIVGRAGVGNNEFATTYAVDSRCNTCGRVAYKQVNNLVLNLLEEEPDPYEIGYFQHDICETDFHEVVASKKVKTLLEVNQISGVILRPVEHFKTGVAIPRPYYQLSVEPQIGTLTEPTRIQRMDLCPTCGQYKQVLFDALPGTKESEFYFRRSGYAGQTVLRTTDCFGRVPNFACKLVISQRFYRLLKQYEVTGFWVQPAHLVD